MPNITIVEDNKFKKLTQDQRADLALTISKWWKQFHNARKKQIDTARELDKYICLNQPARNTEADWKSDIRENVIYNTWDSIKSQLWREVWADEDQMFDVAGVTPQDEQNADKQKQSVVHALRDMKASLQFDRATDYWGRYGDFVYKIDWKSKKKKVKRFDKFDGFQEIELPIEENANIEAVDPLFFNFDTQKCNSTNGDEWDKCIKIYKRFATLAEIKANPLYTLTKAQQEELTRDDDTQITDKDDNSELALKTEYGDLFEVLYLHGDFKYEGVEYHNVVAEVLAGKFLIFFRENPVYINPFVFATTQRDSATSRGISPLHAILEMSKGKEELINKAADIAELNANPCHWVSDDFLKEKYKDGVVEYSPGRMFEYDTNFSGGFPQAIKFDSSGILNIINALANNISDTSSINANAMGNITQGKRTATEISIANKGADSRTAMKLDYIYQANIEVIKKVAELLAMFKLEPELILVRDKGARVAVEITNAIRQGNYQYIYEDRNALLDRRAKIQEAFTMINASAQNPVLFERIDWVKALKTGLESIGFENVDKFFKEPSEIDQAAEQIKQLPADIQQAVIQTIAPVLQQATITAQAQTNAQNGNPQGGFGEQR